MNIRDIIVKEHGNNCILALAEEADAIIAEHQALLDAGEYNNCITTMCFGGSPAEAAAKDAYNRIKDRVFTKWLSAIPRPQMVATLNTLGAIMGGAPVEPLPGESF